MFSPNSITGYSSQTAVPGPGASTASRNLLKMQNPSPISDLQIQKHGGWNPKISILTDSHVILMHKV